MLRIAVKNSLDDFKSQFIELISSNEDYPKVKLSELFDISSGGTPSRSKEEYWDSGTIPWVKISDMYVSKLVKTEEYITELGLKKSSAQLYPKGTFLYSIFATLGVVTILDIDAATNQAIAGLIPKQKVDEEYILIALNQLHDYVNRIGRGNAQNNINLSILKNIEIAMPPDDVRESFSRFVRQSDKSKFQVGGIAV